MQVPRYQVPTVLPSGQGLDYQRISASPDAFGAGIGRGLVNVGDSISRAAAVMEANQKKIAAETADAAANDAYVQFRIASGERSAEFQTQSGDAAVNEYEPYIKDLDTIRKEAATNLSPEAKVLFERKSQDAFLTDIDAGAMHAAKERQKYVSDQAKAVVDIAVTESSTKFEDEELFQANLKLINETVATQGDINGWPDAQVKVTQRQLTSAAWAARLNSMADSDPEQAWQTFGRVRDGMTVELRLATEGKIRQSLQQKGSYSIANEFMSGATPAGKNLIDRVQYRESRGRTDKNIIGGDGELGPMQVLPSTGAMVARQLGVPWDPKRMLNDFAYNRLIGGTYLNQMMRLFGGNETLAVAAYNAGPGAVRSWIKRFGMPRTPEESAAWAQKIPIPGTREYVREVVYGGGKPSVPTMAVGPDTSYTDFATRVNAAKEYMAGMYPDNPMMANMVTDKMFADYNQMKSIAADQVKAMYDYVGKGALGETSLETLLADPLMKNAYDQLGVDQQLSVQKILRDNANEKQPEISDPGVLDKYHYYRGLAVTDPEKFQKSKIAEDTSLPANVRKELIDQQTAKKDAPAATPSQSSALTIMKPATDALGLADDDYAIFVSKFMEQLDIANANNGGKPLTETQVREIGTKLLQVSDSGFFSDKYLFEENEARIRSELGIEENVEIITEPPPISTETRTEIIQNFLDETGVAPTEFQINQIWMRMQLEELKRGR